MQNKTLLISVIIGIFILVSGVLVSAYVLRSPVIDWSNSQIGFPEPTPKPETRECSNDEWNSYFEDYRSGILTKQEAINKLKECNQW
jgi:hypothetical protein